MQEVRNAVKSLKNALGEIAVKRSELDQEEARLKRALSALESEDANAAKEAKKSPPKKRRRRKGKHDLDKRIAALLSADPNRSWTTTEIANKINRPSTSVSRKCAEMKNVKKVGVGPSRLAIWKWSVAEEAVLPYGDRGTTIKPGEFVRTDS